MTRRRTATFFVAVIGSFAGCADIRPAHFADLDPIEEVADDQPIPMPQRQLTSPLSYADVFARRPAVEGLDFRRDPDAGDVNSLDEVPPSSWFVHPAGGPLGAVTNVVNGPPVPPFLVLRRPPESGRSGLVVIDARGLRYELGRDPVDRPWLRTTAAVVASHLMRAIGYRTPEVSIIALSETDLHLEELDGAPPPTPAVRDFLGTGPPPTKGRYRVSATRWPIGVDVGPTPPHEPRADDPNDRVPHPDRRTLRALAVVRAWLRAPDFGLKSLRDVYVGPPNQGHLVHFVVGLEGALGNNDARGQAVEPRSIEAEPDPTAGENPLRLLVTLGLWARQRQGDPLYPFIGDFDATVEDGDYGSIGFEPTYRSLPPDEYWSAKQMAQVSRDVIEAAVDSAAPPNRATRARLIDVLERRRLAVIARAYAKVTPCEVVGTDANSVTIRDAGFSAVSRTLYEAQFVDDAGDPIGATRLLAPGIAVFKIPLPRAPYVILRLRVTRGQVVAPRPLEVHFRARRNAMRLVGVRH